MLKGIDISHWNKVIDYQMVADQVDFVILKAGGSDRGLYTDSTFYNNYERFTSLGVPCGAYYYVGNRCISYEDGEADGKRMLSIINNRPLQYPIIIDLESTQPYDREGATDACIGFCDVVEKANCYAMIYASDISGFKDRLNIGKLSRFDKWVARYGSKPQYVKSYGIWQKSSKGKIDGIIGNVDLDEAYLDYPHIMKRTGLNHC